MKEEQSTTILNDHSNDYTPCRLIHKELGDNILAGFIKLDPRRSIEART